MVRNNRKVRTGRVISNKMDKTVVVAIEWRQQHPVYKKSVRKISKLHAHDPENRCQIGDIVNLMETRPLSKPKRWRVTDIVNTDDIRVMSPEQVEVLEDDETKQNEEAQVEATNSAGEEPEESGQADASSDEEEPASTEEEENN